jgi:hypothetical protein
MTNLEKLKKDLTANDIYGMICDDGHDNGHKNCWKCPVEFCYDESTDCKKSIKDWCEKEAEE